MEKANGEVLNIGSNYEISIGNLVALIMKLIGTDVEVHVDDARIRPDKSEVERLWADNRRAMEILGWNPQYSLESGLQETIDWLKDNLAIYKSDIYNV